MEPPLISFKKLTQKKTKKYVGLYIKMKGRDINIQNSSSGKL